MNAYESITRRDAHPLMIALGRGLPIALLVDLIDPNGPRSAEMFEQEGMSSDDEKLGVTHQAARTA